MSTIVGSMSLLGAMTKLQVVKSELDNRKKALGAFDEQSKTMTIELDLRGSILQKIDPRLVGLPLYSTGIKLFDLAIDLFYKLKQTFYKKTVIEHKSAWTDLNHTLSSGERLRQRKDLVFGVYLKALEFSKLGFNLGGRQQKEALKYTNNQFGLLDYKSLLKPLEKSQINADYQVEIKLP